MASQSTLPPPTTALGEGLELDLRAYELRRDGRPVKLERIPMELLRLLVERRGELVTREQIVERIWGPGVSLDTDNSINGAVRKLRQALRDNPDQPRFVQTVSGLGYRYIAPVVEPPAPALPSAGEQARQPEPARPVGARRRSWIAVGGMALAVTGALLAALMWPRDRSGAGTTAPGRVMLAVLPFENLTGDPSQDYFSDGLTEEMIARLGNLNPHRLGVIARTSVMQYKVRPAPLDRIGRDLGVQYMLEGSVRRDAERLRITVQLIQAGDQSHLWSRQYDRELSSVLAVQGEIAQTVANEIRLTLAEGDRADVQALGPGAYKSYDLYLKGRFFWNKRTRAGFDQAIEAFQAAIVEDPKNARAYAGLADSYALMNSYSQGQPAELVAKARAAALKALQLDEGLAEAHTSLALILENYDWDWKRAEAEFRRAIELDANYATAHHWYAEYLAFQGRFDEALAEIERARQLDPLSLIMAADHGAILYHARQYDRAIEQFHAVLEMEPGFSRAEIVIDAYAQKGMYPEALAATDAWHQLYEGPWIWAKRAYILGRAGRHGEALRALQRLERLSEHQHVDPAALVLAHVGMGNTDRAMTWLETAYADRSGLMATLKVDPAYDPLRGDPRFQALLRRVGLGS